MVRLAALLLFLAACAHGISSYIVMNLGGCNVCVNEYNFDFASNDKCTQQQWEKADPLKKCFVDRGGR